MTKKKRRGIDAQETPGSSNAAPRQIIAVSRPRRSLLGRCGHSARFRGFGRTAVPVRNSRGQMNVMHAT
jgi:hypothetical protein